MPRLGLRCVARASGPLPPIESLVNTKSCSRTTKIPWSRLCGNGTLVSSTTSWVRNTCHLPADHRPPTRALGTPLDWPEAKKNADHVRQWGIEQLLEIWKRAKGKERDALRWGDEIEYLVVAFEEECRKVRLSLRQADILKALAEDEALSKQGGCVPDLQVVKSNGDAIPVFHPEFGRFMLEATPGKPWGIGFKDLLDVEPNMKWRLVNIII